MKWVDVNVTHRVKPDPERAAEGLRIWREAWQRRLLELASAHRQHRRESEPKE